jgi:hypothetical protein
MPTLDATVGGLASNSYLTLDQALAIAEIVLSGPAYQAFIKQANDERSVCLMRATRMIERSFEWSGYRVDDDQALAWPRHRYTMIDAVYTDDGLIYGADIIPKDVQDATVMVAAHLAQGFAESDALNAPATNIKLGPISVSFDNNKTKTKATIPEDVISSLAKLGEYIGVSSGGRAIMLERS